MSTKTSLRAEVVSEDDVSAIFRSSTIAMVITNPRLPDNPIVYVNRAFERLTGYTSSAAVGRNCRFLQADLPQGDPVVQLRQAIEREEQVSVVLPNARANGESFMNALLVSPVHNEDGEAVYFVGLQSEIQGDDPQERLAHFEQLISEVQHRVKNHLSMILGLIRMKARSSDTPGEFADLSRRIESLQLLYEEMTAARATRNEDKILLGSYLGRVANAIAYLDGRPGVRMNVNVEPLVVGTETAVRIGLIVSEVLTNAMQHAFRDQRSGLVELRVTRTDNGGVRAIISDDGVGIPRELDWPNESGLGGRIVIGLSEGLNATLNVVRGAVGTIITLDVPAAN